MENLDQFMDQLLTERGVNVEGEVREQMKADMAQRLVDQIDRATLAALNDEQAKELSEKLDDPNFTQDQVTEFIQSTGIDTERIALETMVQFRALYLGASLSEQGQDNADAQGQQAAVAE